MYDPQQRVRLMDSESSGNEEEDNEKAIENQDAENDEFAPVRAEGDKREKQQFFIFNPTPKLAYYPQTWKGPTFLPRKITDVYGLIVAVSGKIVYILSSFKVHTFRPQYLKENDDKLIGCWVLMELNNDLDILAAPLFANAPLHTRVFIDNDGKLPYFLIYDYVKLVDEYTVESKFLGKIENEIDLSCKGRSWANCNVEYMINVEFKSSWFTHRCRVVKFQGSVPLNSGLPNLLSFKPRSDDKASFLKDRFSYAFYSSEQIKLQLKKEVDYQRQKRIRFNQRRLPHLSGPAKVVNDVEIERVEQELQDVKIEQVELNEEIHEIDAQDDEYILENGEEGILENESDSEPKQSTSTHNPIQTSTQNPSSNSIHNPTSSSNPNVIRARPVPVPIARQTNGFNHEAQNRDTKTILITYAAAGYAYSLAKYFLANGHKVVVHTVDIPYTQKFLALKTQYPDRFKRAQGKLGDTFVRQLIDGTLASFGPIDTVIHFASAICKPGPDHGSYKQLEYLFEENVKPFVYLSKYLITNDQTVLENLKLMVVAPIYNPSAIKQALLPNTETFMSYLRLTIDEIAHEYGSAGVSVRLVESAELANNINYVVEPGNTENVCQALYEIEKSM